ncbi:MAG TPA: 3-hydroxyanthranilate 3,4-dioxygenase [Candidatus Eisenbacteria bacterium]|nr:3-hydroxyanthranilate 3,4-dioxygenase [Candidatus Eisenbacteria bacterium]
MSQLTPLGLMAWIEEYRAELKPPVGNKLVWPDTEFNVMVVGGPNTRKDYHVDPGEEFFYQLQGDMVLKIIEDGKPRDIRIREGDIFLLPPGLPHSPQRFPDTVGLVIERRRRPGEIDHLRWYCESCGEILYDASFHCTNLGTQLKPIIEAFHADVAKRTCRKCGAVMSVPQAATPA